MLTGKKLGPYKLTREVGRGEMSTVYEAVDTRMGRTVAVKIQSVPPNLLPEQREALKLRMEREARSIGRLSHPNVVKIFVVGEQDNLHYIVMEYLNGVSLQERLDTGPLSPAEAANVLDQVAAGLEAVHAQGVVHRDIKPSNIMILSDRTVKLTDFGVAYAADDPSLTSHGMMVGSPLYMSPEQANGGPATPASDVWSLGVLLYHMLTGKAPFVAETVPSVLYKIVHEKPILPPSVPEEMAAVLGRALDKNSDQRFASAGALAAAFRATLSDPTVVTHPAVLPPPSPLLVPVAPLAAGGVGRAVLSAGRAFAPRVPRPLTTASPRRARPTWQIPALITLFALGGASVVLSQRGRDNAPLGASDRRTASSSLPELSPPPPPQPSVAVGSMEVRPGPAASDKPRQVAMATPKKNPVRIFSAKVTQIPKKQPTAVETPVARVKPPAIKATPNAKATPDAPWKRGVLLPPRAGEGVERMVPGTEPKATPPVFIPEAKATPPVLPTPAPAPSRQPERPAEPTPAPR
ncbi:MAG: protein kinase, partial [Akkermansiaceae bacterium]|nr:protein kinase [Armatimonadota bacterium]